MLRPLHTAAHDAVLAEVAGFVHAPRRILDVGCGTGRLAAALLVAYPGALVIGVDPSRAMLFVAAATNRTSTPPRLIHATVERLTFAGASLALVTSSTTYRHWINHDAGIRQITRVLVPAGLFALADVFEEPRRRLLARMARRRPQVPAELTTRLTSTDLTIMAVHRTGGLGPLGITVVVAAR